MTSTQFDLRQALRNLDIHVKPFGYDDPSGTVLQQEGLRGYSSNDGQRYICINPTERWPAFVTFHEMTHHLRGDCTLHKKFGIDPREFADRAMRGEVPSWREIARYEAWADHKERNYELVEAECHAGAIIACQLTGTPFDFRREAQQMAECYVPHWQLPPSVMANARKHAEKIFAAGKIDQRSMSWRGGLVAA